MSKTPLITKNDGTDWHDAVPKLRTDELGASSTDWVQEDDTKAASLKVTANGTYAAASAGKYGYDYVMVSVKGGSATGIGPDGNEHTVYPDPETGKLIDEVIPSSIIVTTPPTVTTYQDGDTIDFTGIVVTAYTMDGEVWEDSSHPGGVIPVSELEFPVTVAHYDSQTVSHDGYAEIDDTTGLPAELVQAFPLVYGENVWFTGSYNTGANGTYGPGFVANLPLDPVYSFVISYLGSYVIMLCSKSNFSGTSYRFNEHGNYQQEIAAQSVTVNGETFYIANYTSIEKNLVYTISPTPVAMYSGYMGQYAYVILFGDRTPADASVQEIPVNWQRPGDGAILEATFPINVTQAGT